MEAQITRTCVIAAGVRRLHSTYPDGTEIVEEFNISTHELLNRKVKHLSKLGEGKWEWEVGEGPRSESEIKQSGENVMKSQPIFLRKDTLQEFQWRVRNLPYPPSTYSVTGDAQTGKITIRTSNKKYFKVFSIPDLVRARAHLDPGLIRWGHEFSTLIINYPKPRQVLEYENSLKAQLEQARKNRGNRPPVEGDVECVQQ